MKRIILLCSPLIALLLIALTPFQKTTIDTSSILDNERNKLTNNLPADALTRSMPNFTFITPPMPTEKVLYYVKPKGGVTGRTFLSSSLKGDIVDCWHKDEGMGRQQWVFQKLYSNSDIYHIEVYSPGGNRKLLSSCPDGTCVDLWHKDTHTGYQQWRLLPLPNGAFHIVNVGTKGRTFLSSCSDGTCVDLWHKDTKSGAQQWQLIPEDIVLDEIVFETEQGVKTSQPDFVTTATIDNKSDRDQEMTITFSKKATVSSSFQREQGFSFSIEAEVQFGTPLAMQTTIGMSATTSHTWTYGKSESREDGQVYNFPVNVPKRSTVKAKAIVKMVKIDVPYTAIGYSEKTGEKITCTGTWTGISAGEVSYSIIQN